MSHTGDRIELTSMPEDLDPVPRREPKGTVTHVRRITQPGGSFLQVDWDNGRLLNLAVPPDQVRRL